jgi:hypothetical protein
LSWMTLAALVLGERQRSDVRVLRRSDSREALRKIVADAADYGLASSRLEEPRFGVAGLAKAPMGARISAWRSVCLSARRGRPRAWRTIACVSSSAT